MSSAIRDCWLAVCSAGSPVRVVSRNSKYGHPNGELVDKQNWGHDITWGHIIVEDVRPLPKSMVGAPGYAYRKYKQLIIADKAFYI